MKSPVLGMFSLMVVVALIMQAKPAQALVTINVKTDCGALGNGVANDTAAFQQAASMLQSSGGGTLEIPAGTYIVGKQNHVPGQYPYYQPEPVFAVKNLPSLTINGHGATLKTANGLRVGTFDPNTGAPVNMGTWFSNWDYVAAITPEITPAGTRATGIISIETSSNINVNNLTIDGNSPNLIVGYPWGTTGIEVDGADGLWLGRNTNVQVTNVISKYHPRDGIHIAHAGLTLPHADTPHILTNCQFDYNGRQGLSWVGGIGVTATNCTFSHTGRSVNVNPASGGRNTGTEPGDGLDIEAENSVTRKGSFSYCNFEDNAGVGMAAGGGAASGGGYATFDHCTFWGTTTYSILSQTPGLKYTNCKVYGAAYDVFGSSDPTLATQFTTCDFEDKPYTGSPNTGLVFRPYLLGTVDGGQNVSLTGCTFTANQALSMWYEGTAGLFSNCTWTHKWSARSDQNFQAYIRGATITGGKFKESGMGTTKTWYINVGNTTIANPGGVTTTITGPRVHWRWLSDPIVSPIAAGVYNTP